jgi:hypothetical protein
MAGTLYVTVVPEAPTHGLVFPEIEPGSEGTLTPKGDDIGPAHVPFKGVT